MASVQQLGYFAQNSNFHTINAALQQYHRDVGYSEYCGKDQPYDSSTKMALPIPISASQQDPALAVGKGSGDRIPPASSLQPSFSGENKSVTPGEWQAVKPTTLIPHVQERAHAAPKRALEHVIATELSDSATAIRHPDELTRPKPEGDELSDPDDLYRFKIREKKLPTQDPVVDT
ncbi:hypothetical protein IWQ61_008961, partial [Dispira simplex]